MIYMRASIKGALLMFGLGAALLPAIIMAVLISYMQRSIVEATDKSFEALAVESARRITEDVLGMCQLIQQSRDEALKKKRIKAWSTLEKYGAPDIASDTFSANVKNQFDTSEQGKRTVPVLKFGTFRLGTPAARKKLSEDLAALKKATRTDYSIMARLNENGDMLRIASTLEDSEGNPLTMTYMPARRKSGGAVGAVEALLSGQTFRGLAEIDGAVKLASYEPLFDARQNVIGALEMVVSQNMTDELCQYMNSVRIGENGYVWALENQDAGKTIFRVSKDGVMNGSVLQLDDNNLRRKNFTEILDAEEKLSPGEIGMQIRTLSASDKGSHVKRIVCYARFAPWNWIVGTTSYTDDFSKSSALVRAQAGNILTKLSYGSAFVLLLTALFVWYVINRLNFSVTNIKAIGHALARGDISGAKERMEGYSKIAKSSLIKETRDQFSAVENMANNISALTERTQNGVSQLASGAAKIAYDAKELTVIIDRQAESVREVGVASKSIRNSAFKLNKQAKTAASDVEKALQTAEQSSLALESLRQNSEALLKSTSQIMRSLSHINENADKVSSVVSAIKVLSERTNMLSLNAAVEAEKAGELGLGFAVVSREIRKLADKTAIAARDIERVIGELQSSVNSGVMEMDRFASTMREGSQTIHSATVSLERTVSEVSTLAPIFEELASEISGESEGAKKINLAMEDIGRTSLAAAAGVLEFKRATESIDAAGAALKTEISAFKLGGDDR